MKPARCQWRACIRALHSRRLRPAPPTRRLSNAYTESYNLNLQQQFGQGFVMEMGYIGSQGKHLAHPEKYQPVPLSRRRRYPTLRSAFNSEHDSSRCWTGKHCVYRFRFAFELQRALVHGAEIAEPWDTGELDLYLVEVAGLELTRIAGYLHIAEQLRSEGRLRPFGL